MKGSAELAVRVHRPPTSDPVTLAGVLGSLGHEVEGWETISPTFSGVVVERVETVSPHPDADRVRLTQVDYGSGDLLEVVCGAWNFEAGAVVAFAPVGAQLNPEGKPMEIEARAVEGVVSHGMICSASELGLGDDRTGSSSSTGWGWPDPTTWVVSSRPCSP